MNLILCTQVFFHILVTGAIVACIDPKLSSWLGLSFSVSRHLVLTVETQDILPGGKVPSAKHNPRPVFHSTKYEGNAEGSSSGNHS